MTALLRLWSATAVGALFFFSSIDVMAQDSQRLAIKRLRALSNKAIQDQKPQRIADFYVEDLNITTGAGTVINGKEALVSYLKDAFLADSELYFVRRTNKIKINHDNDRAWERGSWKAQRKGDPKWKGPSGKYAAMWVKKKGTWNLRSQLFVAL